LVTPAYFETFGIRLVRGRFFNDGDREGAVPVTIVSEALARLQWPNRDPIGLRVRLLDAPPDGAKTRYMTVVGVVTDVRNQGLNAPPRQEMYVPLAQQTSTGLFFRSLELAIRTSTEPLSLANSVRQVVWSLDRTIPITGVQTMEEILRSRVVQQRFNTALLGFFALLALFLSSAGIYSVIAYAVSQRTHEIGVRMALGAQAADVLRMVLLQGMSLALIGVGIGLGASFALTRWLQELLFEVSATDPLTLASIAFLLIIVAFLACWIPARRATRVDPLSALRCE
jgi:putative ABC transport system permease protein